MGSGGRPLQRGGGNVAVVQTPSANVGSVAPQSSNCRADANRARTKAAGEMLALREGQELPEGYTYVTRTPVQDGGGRVRRAGISADTVDLSTPPEGERAVEGGDVETAKRKVAAKRNATRNTNKQANAAFAREMKESLAGGRPPAVNVSEGQTHLKARWHSAAKEVAYNILDLSKDGWKAYSMFEKGKIHKELNEKYKFDPPLDRKRVEKYLAGHLRISRGAWKAHWQKYGDNERHQNCPQDSWEKLIQWWPTEACMEEATNMACRRSLVKNGSKMGRKTLVERMDEEVRNTPFFFQCRMCSICGCMRDQPKPLTWIMDWEQFNVGGGV